MPTENLRFRDDAISFKVSENFEDNITLDTKSRLKYKYPAMTKKFDGFSLSVEAGSFNGSEIIVLLGENICTFPRDAWSNFHIL